MTDIRTILLLVFLCYFAKGHKLKGHIVLRSITDKSIDDDWWRTAIIYQIYPRSFMDSNGDGYGDLQGIISKLDYLEDLGVTAAWLSPIYPSPGVDQGYDISDYKAVDPLFGTMDDLTALVEKAHKLGIKIILDFVPNHTSNEHDWFIKSEAKDPLYDNYYIWREGKNGNPPNNWISDFGDSAWTYSKTRNEYYLHQFAPEQPDLNYRNPDVVKDIKDILKFWLDFGIDGFRMDAVPFLFEDTEFKDEPLSGATGVEANEYGYLKHVYTQHLDETYAMIYEFRAVLDEYNKIQNYSRIMITEAYADTAEKCVAYYGNSTVDGAHFTFNFIFITDLSSNFTVDDIITIVNKWNSHLPKKYVSNWVLGNHDNHRIASRLGVENVDAFNMLTAFLPGAQVTYMGEEIGMEDGNVSCSQGYDPQAIKNCSNFEKLSRDFERTPFQWDDSVYAGFSDTKKSTWLPVSDKCKVTNLKAQNKKGIKSHYNVYKGMMEFRENFKNISYDSLALIKLADSVLQIVRSTDTNEFVYLFNAGDSNQKVHIFSDNSQFTVQVASVKSQFSIGDILPNPVTLYPHESIVLQRSATKSWAHKALASTWLCTSLSLLILLSMM